jgi:hypothetical protein
MGDEHYLISPPAPLATQSVPPQIPFEAMLGIIQGIISLKLFTGDEHYPRFLPSTLQRRQKSSHSKRAQLWIVFKFDYIGGFEVIFTVPVRNRDTRYHSLKL